MKDRVILLVEDNPDDAELTKLALSRNNLRNEVVWAKDGVEALEYLFGTGSYAGRDVADIPVVVLLDLKMPRVDGLEVLKQLRADPRTAIVPVVVLTSSREEEDRMRGYSLGANSYVRKPVNFDEFVKSAGQLGMYWLLLNEAPKD